MPTTIVYFFMPKIKPLLVFAMIWWVLGIAGCSFNQMGLCLVGISDCLFNKAPHPVADNPTRIEVRSITPGDLHKLESLFDHGQSPLGYSRAIDPHKRYHVTDSLVYTVLRDWEAPDHFKQEHKNNIIHYLKRLPNEDLLFSLQMFLYVEPLAPRDLQLSIKLDKQELTNGLVEYLTEHGDPDLAERYMLSGIPTYVESAKEWYGQNCYSRPDAADEFRQCIWFGSRHPRVFAMDLNELEPIVRPGGDQGENFVSGDPSTIDSLIYSASTLLDKQGHWLDRQKGRQVYETLQKMDDNAVGDGLARHVQFRDYRTQVLLLGVKLGISGSDTKLLQVLSDHGDGPMAEDFLNSGFPNLDEGVQQWAKRNGYKISPGQTLGQAEWGNF